MGKEKQGGRNEGRREEESVGKGKDRGDAREMGGGSREGRRWKEQREGGKGEEIRRAEIKQRPSGGNNLVNYHGEKSKTEK